MSLTNLTRGEIEASAPHVLDVDDTSIKVMCLNTYALWALKSDISVTPSLARHGYWEAWITSWFTHNVEPGQTVLDIGANCGYYTRLFEHLVGSDGIVIAYEASPEYAALLRRTQIDEDASYVVREVALSDSIGEVVLSYPGDYTGSASIMTDFVGTDWGEVKHVTVKSTTLDDEFKAGPDVIVPDIVKIDAESAEEVIWNGGKSLWYSDNPPVVVLEYSHTRPYSQEFDKELFEYGEVTRIGYNGIEEPITPEWLKNLTDWDMIVIRRKSS